MSKREIYEAKVEALVLPIVEANNFELVDVEYVKEAGTWYLRIYIDKEGGIFINDCELVSRALSEIMDQDDPIEDAYILEVSSPGLGRPIKKDKDFQRNFRRKGFQNSGCGFGRNRGGGPGFCGTLGGAAGKNEKA